MEMQRDVNLTTNVGGALAFWNGVEEDGGELTLYDATPVGGPPAANFSTNVRSPLTYNVKTRIPGADQTERDAFRVKYAEGQTFDAKSAAAGTGDMKITGRAAAIGKRFVITKSTASTAATAGSGDGNNSELTIMLREIGPTPA